MSGGVVTNTAYLIIGNSAGGIGAAEAIREVDTMRPITIVSGEPYPAYSRPLISKYLAKERDLEDMRFRPADFYERNDIAPLLGKRVTRLLLNDRAVELGDGHRVVWEKLLIATGGVPIVPGIESINKRGVFPFITLDDARAIDEFVEGGQKAVVIGGGLIGISATEALVKRGVEVSIVEMKDRVLNTILDEEGSSIAGDALEKAGVELLCGQTVLQILGNEAVTGVVLSSTDLLPCNMVVVAIGVVPHVDLAGGTGIEVNRGIVVDRHMATSHEDVYACGDVAEAYDFVYHSNRLTPIWPNAYIGGRTAGYNMAGVETQYPGGTAMNSLTYFGLDITTAGIVAPPDGDGYQCLSRNEDGAYRKLVLKDDALVGMICIGEIEKSGILYSLMRDETNVESFKESLLADDFGLASLPREMWQERLGKPHSGAVFPREACHERVEEYVGGE